MTYTGDLQDMRIQQLEAQIAQLLAALERSVELIDVIMAYAENTPSPVVLNAATIGQEIEQALADAKERE